MKNKINMIKNENRIFTICVISLMMWKILEVIKPFEFITAPSVATLMMVTLGISYMTIIAVVIDILDKVRIKRLKKNKGGKRNEA